MISITKYIKFDHTYSIIRPQAFGRTNLSHSDDLTSIIKPYVKLELVSWHRKSRLRLCRLLPMFL